MRLEHAVQERNHSRKSHRFLQTCSDVSARSTLLSCREL